MAELLYQTESYNAEKKIKNVSTAQELVQFKVEYLGRKGVLARFYATLKGAPENKKPVIGKAINDLRIFVERLIDQKRAQIEQKEKQSQTRDDFDVTIPGVPARVGHRHLLTQLLDEICGILKGLGFVVRESPEIETEFNNFTALNIPLDHPSRDAFDTFYLQEKDPGHQGRHLLLRSHTSPGQIRIMKEFSPPLAVAIPGKVYRPDAVDASHSFMFHQVEGLLVDKDLKFSDLKGLMTVFCQRFFSPDIKMRFRPHFFPFTEPSAEVDISCYLCGGKGCSVCGRKGWLEIMGCGMVHPKVFEAVGYKKGIYTGIAFGMGIERMAMLKYGINDIRIFFENDVRFLEQF